MSGIYFSIYLGGLSKAPRPEIPGPLLSRPRLETLGRSFWPQEKRTSIAVLQHSHNLIPSNSPTT